MTDDELGQNISPYTGKQYGDDGAKENAADVLSSAYNPEFKGLRVGLVDEYGFETEYTPEGAVRVAEVKRIIGGGFPGTVLDTNIWTKTETAGGTFTSGGSIGTLRTNTTANGSVVLVSNRSARFIAGRTNAYFDNVRIPQAGVANNLRRWGAYDANNGFFFQMNGSALGIGIRKAGVDTIIPVASWDHPMAMDTDNHVYEIYWTNQSAWFVMGGELVYTAVDGPAPLTATVSLKVTHENINSAGATADVTMEIRGCGINALGPTSAEPDYAHIVGVASPGTTATLRYGAGKLLAITINGSGPVGSSITIYNNTAGSGAIIAVIDAAKIAGPVTLQYGASFDVGLTIVAVGVIDITVIFD